MSKKKEGSNDKKKEKQNLPEKTKEEGLEPKEGLESPIDPDVLEQLPPEVREIIRTTTTQGFYAGPMPNPVAKKITENHITDIIDAGKQEDKREYNLQRLSRLQSMLYLVIFVAVFIFITIYFAQSDKETYQEILKLIVIFGGGFGAGYGLKSRKNN